MNSPTQTSSAPQRFFYGWVIVGISTFALIVSNGLAILGLPVFYKPIQDEFLASGAVTTTNADSITAFGAGLTFLLAGIFSLIVGLFIEKISLRKLMSAGCVVLGVALLVYSRAREPWQIYAAHSLLGISLGFVGVMIQSVLISNWFQRMRGVALGIVLTGTSFGGVIVPQLARPLIAQFGWREAMLILSSVVWFVLLPAIYFLVRDRAGDLGLGFDGTEIEPESSALKSAAAEGKSLFGAFATKEFWLLAIGAAALFYPIFATSQQFILHIQKSPTIAASPIMASIAQSMLSATSICGKFLFGWLSDRLSKVRVMLMCCTLMFLASTILLGFLASNTIFIYLIPFGLGYGGTFVLIQLLAVDFFGLREIGKILGALTVIETAGGFLGAQVTGRIASANGGDYTTAFYGVTVAAAIALICVALLNLKMFGAGSEESQK